MPGRTQGRVMAAHRWRHKRNTAAAKARAAQYATPEHKAMRQAGQRAVDAGYAHCWRCGTYIAPGTKWHLGHDDYDRTVYRGVECVTCNLRAAARKGAMVRNMQAKARRQTDVRW